VLQGRGDAAGGGGWLRVVPTRVERYLTVREVADRLRVSTATAYAMVERGELAHVRVSNAIRVRESDLP
jgi:excisionase family DNA binding protein